MLERMLISSDLNESVDNTEARGLMKSSCATIATRKVVWGEMDGM